jgi:hypothetical protein
VPPAPHRVHWTYHALEKAAFLGLPHGDVERLLIERHRFRRRNARSADWRLTIGRIVIAYDYPDRVDAGAARIVTLWRLR